MWRPPFIIFRLIHTYCAIWSNNSKNNRNKISCILQHKFCFFIFGKEICQKAQNQGKSNNYKTRGRAKQFIGHQLTFFVKIDRNMYKIEKFK
jgi:hypothetical protein